MVSTNNEKSYDPDYLDKNMSEDDGFVPFSLDISEKDMALFYEALETLSDRQIKCIELSLDKGMSQRQIGNYLGIHRSTVRNYLERATRHIKEYIENV